jgi:hypothetical protein
MVAGVFALVLLRFCYHLPAAIGRDGRPEIGACRNNLVFLRASSSSPRNLPLRLSNEPSILRKAETLFDQLKLSGNFIKIIMASFYLRRGG